MSLEKWILVIAAILAVGTGVFIFQPTEQNPAIVEQYQGEVQDDVTIKDLIIDVSEGTTKQEVIKYVKEKYPDYEIVSISQDGLRYLIRIKEVTNQ